jgi:hypothetical protein
MFVIESAASYAALNAFSEIGVIGRGELFWRRGRFVSLFFIAVIFYAVGFIAFGLTKIRHFASKSQVKSKINLKIP